MSEQPCVKYQQLAELIKTLGNDDPDWVAIILFVRNLLTRLTVYSDEKKVEIQREVFAELANKDFSKEGLERVVVMLDMFLMQTIGTLELEEALAQEKRSAAALLNEMREIMESMHGNADRRSHRMDVFKEEAVGAIKSEKDRSLIVSKVRDMIQDLVVEFKEEARELQDKANTLERTASFDPLLIDLHNRRALEAFLNEAVQEVVDKGRSLCMMMIDVDHFKRVNDTYGHQAGDDVLRALSRIISAHAMQYHGYTARYGGEELVVVVQGMDEEQASVKAEAIRADVDNYDFRIRTDGKLCDPPIQFTVSIGVAQCASGWGITELIHAADSALYQAKERGRNQVVSVAVSGKN